ncbi:RNA-binding domain-containing protein [Mollisia scopiformis]|uniref:RNA-binding domain-containing protein n=1 Tax=Mollisia scopiformis TaxID=149040 RepID=A0A132BD49_MOLSC|nr:RNA-binding domain-containing protein [Mollisia scopiformis]KUJ10326.1 RNA-binding domain-containing protein [Mollisia scopiformis]
MLFSEDDAPLLKKWIVKRLENTSDADADVLADYVLALLRHDGDVETVRALCEREMPDFLKEDSTIFVRDVFDAINYKSYMPGAAPPPRRPSLPFAPPSGPSAPSYGNLGNGAPMGPQNGSRKRSFHERGDTEMQDRGFHQGGDSNGRMFKQPRRGGPGMGRGGYEPRGGRGGYAGNRPPPMNFQNMPTPPGFPGMPPMPSPPPGMPPGMPFFDPREGFAGLEAMLSMGLPMPVLRGMPQAASSPPRQGSPTKPKCRDYEHKGFCARGNTCPYEHGSHSIWIPPVNKVEEYDPTMSLMSTLEANTNRGGFTQFRGGDRGRGRRGQRGTLNPRRGGGRSEFSSNQPNFDKNNTTIVVENIPEDKFSEDEVRKFFSEFGNIVEVTMRPYKRLAIVKYDDWNNAKNAYNSPKVIFDNRFVKVYWYVNQDSLPKPPAVTGANGEAKRERQGSESTAPTPKQEPEIDLEEFARKQAEAQKAHEDKMKKMAEMEAAKKDLEKRQEELLKSQAEEKRKLMEKIAAKSGKSASPAVQPANGSPAPAESKTTAQIQTEALKAQLAALEAEAKSLGIDPNVAEEPFYGGYRGRGRGRGVYRGRGTFQPRGFRGGYRGRGTGVPFSASGRVFNLDNRTKKVALTGADFTDAGKEESLREYLLGIGEYTDLEITPTRTSILFKDRFTAEKFMRTPDNEIPSVGKVEMSWIQTPLPPVNLTPKPSSTAIKVDDDTAMDEGDAMASSPVQAGGEVVEEQHSSYDYDVAGEDEWN